MVCSKNSCFFFSFLPGLQAGDEASSASYVVVLKFVARKNIAPKLDTTLLKSSNTLKCYDLFISSWLMACLSSFLLHLSFFRRKKVKLGIAQDFLYCTLGLQHRSGLKVIPESVLDKNSIIISGLFIEAHLIEDFMLALIELNFSRPYEYHFKNENHSCGPRVFSFNLHPRQFPRVLREAWLLFF